MVAIKALIFDLDGVLADTIELHYRAWKRLADDEGWQFTREDNEALRGLTRENSLNYLLGHQRLDATVTQELLRRKNDYFHEELKQLTLDDAPVGVRALLAEAQMVGLRLGIGSSSKNAVAVAHQLGLHHFFDVIGDGYSVRHSKPSPDIFLFVAERMDVTPDQTVVFEDASMGVRAALDGGFWVIGVGDEQVQKAHIVIPDFADVTLNELLRHLQTIAK